jgi:hypothetical protein
MQAGCTVTFRGGDISAVYLGMLSIDYYPHKESVPQMSVVVCSLEASCQHKPIPQTDGDTERRTHREKDK